MRIVLHGLSFILIILTLLPLMRGGTWWVRVWDFPRVQLLAFQLVLLVWYAITGPGSGLGWTLAAGLLLCAGYQLNRIFPYTPLAPEESKPARTPSPESNLRIMVANVLMSNRETDRLLKIIRDTEPDVLITVETDDWWADQLQVLDEEYPNGPKHPLENTYGMLVFSRLPLDCTEVLFRIEADVPSVRTEVQLRNGEWVWLYGLHPRPPRLGQDSTDRDGELLLVGREVEQLGAPVIVAGDMNDVAWSHTTRLFQRVSSLLDPRRGRGMYNTFSARIPIMRYPLDHVFHSDHFRLVRIERLPDFGSDHFPIFLELSYEPHLRHAQSTPEANGEDEKEATQKIQDARRDS